MPIALWYPPALYNYGINRYYTLSRCAKERYFIRTRRVYIYIYIYIYTKPSTGARCNKRLIFKRSFTSLNSVFVLPDRLSYKVQGCPRSVMVKAMNCGIVVREFVLQSRYYVHFRANTLGKGMNLLGEATSLGEGKLWIQNLLNSA